MYKEYFGLNELPFSIAPDPRYLYMSEQHREALAHLNYGVNNESGFVLLTGEVGTGKTTVCRCLLDKLPEDVDVAFILNPKLTVVELLETVCDELHISYPEGNSSVKVFVDRINTHLLDAHARGRKTVLIIEEAQNLGADVLEQLRLLTNLETNQRKLLQIIMLGQPELRDMLSRPELRQLAQRITARYHISAISKEDVAAYVEHRLTVAGAREKLFETAAVDELYRLSQGIPRLINVICDRALLGAYVEGQKGVGKSTLLKAAREVIGERKAPRVILKWALTGSILIISVTALAATFYNRKIQLFSAKKMQVETSARSPEVQEISGLEWPADQPIRLSKETAYQALFREWNIPDEVRDRDTACKQVRGWGLECIDAKGDLNSLLDLNKPAVIKLSDREGREFYTVLTSIQGSAATVVMGAEVRRVNLDEVSRNWPGTFTFLWRAAPKYHRIVPGDRGAEVQWLERQMALIQGDSKKPRKNRVFDDVLTRQVEAFQRSAGIRTDGIVGPETFIHLNTALSRREPALAQKDR